jgi:hypothetical protein
MTERCCRHSLSIGRAVALTVDLVKGRLLIEVTNGGDPTEESNYQKVFETDIPMPGKGMPKGKKGTQPLYSVVAAVRQAGIALTFV